MTPGFPPLNLTSNASSKSGDIGAPNTVNFGGFGAGSGGSGLGGLERYWPFLLGGVVLLAFLKRKH